MNPRNTSASPSTDATLAPADARAVDVLLDGAAASGDDLAERTRQADKLLGLLDLLPAASPSIDLVSETMRRVEEAPPAQAGGSAGRMLSNPTSVGRTFAHSPDAPEQA
jgi:hypothetical protein